MQLDLPPLKLLERFKRDSHAHPRQGKCVIPFAQRRVVLLQNPQEGTQLSQAEQLRLSIDLDPGPHHPRGRVEAGLALRVDLSFVAPAVKLGDGTQRVIDGVGCEALGLHPGHVLLDMLLIQLPGHQAALAQQPPPGAPGVIGSAGLVHPPPLRDPLVEGGCPADQAR